MTTPPEYPPNEDESNGQVESNSTQMDSILSSIESLKKATLWREANAPSTDLELLKRMGKLEQEVVSLSSLLSSLGKQFNGASKDIVQIMENMAEETVKNTQNLNNVLDRIRALEVLYDLKAEKENGDSQTMEDAEETSNSTNEKKLEKEKVEKQNIEIFNALADCSTSITSLTERVHDLEESASFNSSAIDKLTHLYVDNYLRVKAKLVALELHQKNGAKEMAAKISSMKKKLKNLAKIEGRKQDNLVVEIMSAVLPHIYLNTSVRINFNKKFTQVPQVFAAISGFAMDPDDLSLETKPKVDKLKNSPRPHIYKIQTNFYTARINFPSRVDLLGFSIEVADGRDSQYSAYQWVQVEWMAIGV
ncbi:hypothetical protein PoB_005301500 [Plakobranchus ocellatus]|uniref:H-type lectin domain-containing protein n=1 Tax=Plakobranchus ocellatus TaxID=259542 RepID=A0AAV4C4F3_9GAST|nr:hypothetical protein PoB_005301500 [Plakobranchus ocellatus]